MLEICFEEIPGIELLRKLDPADTTEGAILWDVDLTLVGPPSGAYKEELRRLTDRARLDWQLVQLAHHLEQRVVLRRQGGPVIGGVEALFPMVAAAMGDRYDGDPATLLAASLEYQRMVIEVENCQPLAGIEDTILAIRQSYPGVRHFVCTLCPRWLAVRRPGKLMELMDGYVAVAHELPNSEGHPFSETLCAAHQWMNELHSSAPHGKNHILQVGMPAELVKPNPTTIYALAYWLGIPTNKILVVDDNPLTGIGMARAAGAVGIHAAYGCERTPEANWPHCAHTMHRPDELLGIMQQHFELDGRRQVQPEQDSCVA